MQDFCTMHLTLTAKFHHPTFNRSEVIVWTNELTDKQMPLNTLLASLHYAGGYDLKYECSGQQLEK